MPFVAIWTDLRVWTGKLVLRDWNGPGYTQKPGFEGGSVGDKGGRNKMPKRGLESQRESNKESSKSWMTRCKKSGRGLLRIRGAHGAGRAQCKAGEGSSDKRKRQIGAKAKVKSGRFAVM